MYACLCVVSSHGLVGRHVVLTLDSPWFETNHAQHHHDLFLPPYQVSTQCLSSSKRLTRGGRRPRCVHFCAMHSQCLPKTVSPT